MIPGTLDPPEIGALCCDPGGIKFLDLLNLNLSLMNNLLSSYSLSSRLEIYKKTLLNGLSQSLDTEGLLL